VHFPHPDRVDLLVVPQPHDGIGDDIAVSGGMFGRAAGRGDHGVDAGLLDPDQWGLAGLAGPRAVVVRMMTGRPSSVPPSRPSVASY
jgi:hypothetical protein